MISSLLVNTLGCGLLSDSGNTILNQYTPPSLIMHYAIMVFDAAYLNNSTGINDINTITASFAIIAITTGCSS